MKHVSIALTCALAFAPVGHPVLAQLPPPASATGTEATAGPAITSREARDVRALLRAAQARIEGDLAATPPRIAFHDTVRTNQQLLWKELDDILVQMVDKQSPSAATERLKRGFRLYGLFADAAYPGGVPREVNCAINKMQALLLRGLFGTLEEYDRRFFIKNGEASERLNFLESVITELAFTRAPKGNVASMPNPLEPIARVTLLGYQYYSANEEAKPSSPVYEAGLTYYFFGKGGLGKLHHVGLAAAYQRDLVRNLSLGGPSLHTRWLQLAVFCETFRCVHPVIAASKNVRIVKPERVRQALAPLGTTLKSIF
jgi:hypothetical protein